MILELDCGNSFIKWRVQSVGAVVASGIVDSDVQLAEAVTAASLSGISHCRLVSVRSDEETSRLVALIVSVFGVRPVCAKPARAMAGVTNGYEHFELLGLDRWLALVGGYWLARGACLVLDLGTAVTSDFVSVDGLHQGGFICPGMPLMRDQLRTHTRRIKYDERSIEEALLQLSPGKATVEAVERGCLLMMRGFVLTQLQLAHEYLGEDFTVFLTGGDACLVKDVVPEAHTVQDLVFVGLALACPLS